MRGYLAAGIAATVACTLFFIGVTAASPELVLTGILGLAGASVYRAGDLEGRPIPWYRVTAIGAIASCALLMVVASSTIGPPQLGLVGVLGLAVASVSGGADLVGQTLSGYRSVRLAILTGTALLIIGLVTGLWEVLLAGILGLAVFPFSASVPKKFQLVTFTATGLVLVALAATFTRITTNTVDPATLSANPEARLTYPGSVRDTVTFTTLPESNPQLRTVWYSTANAKSITAWFTSRLNGNGWGPPVRACFALGSGGPHAILWNHRAIWWENTWAGRVSFPSREQLILNLPGVVSPSTNPCQSVNTKGWTDIDYRVLRDGMYAVTLVVPPYIPSGW